MPLISFLDFVAHGGLSVLYRASPAPQELTVDIRTAGMPAEGVANWYFQALIDTINAGGAGSAIFSPSQGFAELLAGPRVDADALRPDHHAVLRVAGVAPIFLRTFVEELRNAGMQQPVTSLSIVGALPVDQGPLSVREHDVRAWLDDPDAYPETWQSPGFPLTFNDLREGATLRVALGGRIGPELRQQLEQLSVRWLVAIRNYVSLDGREVRMNVTRTLPTFGQGKTEFRAFYQEFLYAREPSRAMITNLLARFHEQIAPIAEAEISL